MLNRPDPEPIAGLSAIAASYAAVLCDVWGVVHNGLVPFADAVTALTTFRDGGRPVVLITNAPRPTGPVLDQLDEIGVAREAYDAVVTSGDVARFILDEHRGARVIHIGPDRDLSLYDGLDLTLADAAEATIACCTGLVDDETETVEDYVPLLRELAARGVAMICPNPDLVVERGTTLLPCAGAVALRYEELGGRVLMAGKPYPAIYDMALARIAAIAGGPVATASVLAIGDGLPTDVRGANEAGLDVLFITAGIHRGSYGSASEEIAGVRSLLRQRGMSARAFMPRLGW